ncbi:MAG: hypothetical protein ACLTXL_14875 [Clostridia bacterium]
MVRLGCCLPGGSFMPQGEEQIPASTESVLLEGTQIIAEAGYSYSEICAGLLCELSEEEVARLAQAHGAGKLPLEVCQFYPPVISRFSNLKQEALSALYRNRQPVPPSGIDTIVFEAQGPKN